MDTALVSIHIGLGCTVAMLFVITSSFARTLPDASTVPLPAGQLPPGSVTAVAALPAEPFDLEIDAAGALWFVSMSFSEPDYLYRVIAPSDVQRWLAPELMHNGLGSQVKVDQTGSVWFFAAYDLVLFEPKSETMHTIRFDLDADDALPAGTDGNYPDPGTYITAVLPDGGGALVARNNVPYLTRLDSTLSEVGRIPLPDGLAGPVGLAIQADGRTILALSRQSRVVAQVEIDSGHLVDKVEIDGMTPQAHLEASAESILITASPGGAIRFAADIGLRGDAFERLRPESDILDLSQAALGPAGSVLIYDYPSADFVWLRDGAVQVVHHLDIANVFVAGPQGEAVPARTIPEVLDVAIGQDGTVWYTVGGDLTLYAIAP